MIKELNAGDQLISYFILRKKEVKSKSETGTLYLSLELFDASGRIFGTLWDNVKQVSHAIAPGDILKVKGMVIDFHNRPHLKIDRVRKVVESDDYDLKQLVPRVEQDVDVLLAELDRFIKAVKNTALKTLLELIFHDSEIRKQFGAAPGGKLWHHNYIGGLLEHTLNVTRIAVQSGEIYPGVNRDLLVAAGLLHDLGKIKTYDYKTLIDFTDEGRLLGHIVMGAQMVAEKIREIPDFPAQLEKELLHLILSHQGKLEQASPVVPMMLEGLLLYQADEMDSKANAFLRIRRRETDRKWSSYVKLMNQYFYFGPRKQTEEE